MKKRQHPQRHLAPTKRPLKRWLLLGLLLLTLAGAGMLAMSQWDRWFGVPEDPSYTASGEIERVTITPQEDFAHGRTIAWRAGEEIRPAELLLSRIGERGEALRPERFVPTAEVIATPGGRAVYYQVRLDSLLEGATYTYRLRVQGAKDYTNTFRLPDEERRTSFLFLGDLQGNPHTLNQRIFAYLRQRDLPADFYALSGGLFASSTDEAWRDFYASLGALSGSLPFILSPGMGYTPTTGWSSLIDSRWTAQLPYPLNGPEGFLGRSYFIDFPLFRLIVLDTTDLLGVGSVRAHRTWLEGVLGGASQPWRIILSHHAVDRVEEGEKNLVMHYFFKELLTEGKADLVLQGHDHSYARATGRTPSGDTIPPLFVVSSASADYTRNGFNATFDRLGSGLLLYQHITVEPDRLSYTSYRFPKDSTEKPEKLRYDSVVLTRPTGETVRVKDLARSLPERFDYQAFGDDSRGRKKAAQYAKEVRDRAARRSAKK